MIETSWKDCANIVSEILSQFHDRHVPHLECPTIKLKHEDLRGQHRVADTAVDDGDIVHIRLDNRLKLPVYFNDLREATLPHELAHGWEQILHMSLPDEMQDSFRSSLAVTHARPWSRIYIAMGGTGDTSVGMSLSSNVQYAVRLDGKLRYITRMKDCLAKGTTIVFADGVVVDLATTPVLQHRFDVDGDNATWSQVSLPESPSRTIQTHAWYCRKRDGSPSTSVAAAAPPSWYRALTVNPDHDTTDEQLPVHDSSLCQDDLWASIRAVRRFPFLLRESIMFDSDDALRKLMQADDLIEQSGEDNSSSLPVGWLLLFVCLELRRALVPTLLPGDKATISIDPRPIPKWDGLVEDDYNSEPLLLDVPLGRTDEQLLDKLLLYGPYGKKLHPEQCERIYLTACFLAKKNAARTRMVQRRYYGDTHITESFVFF